MVKHVGGGFDVCLEGFGWYLIRPLCLASSQGLDGLLDFSLGGGVAVYLKQVCGWWDLGCYLRGVSVKQYSKVIRPPL